MTRLCLFMICQVIIILLLTARDEICQSSELRPEASLALLTSSPTPGPIHTGPGHGLCWFIHWSNQTGMTIQNVNMCNSCSRRTHSYYIVIWPAENKTAKCTQRCYLSFSFPSVFVSLFKLDLLRERGALSNIDAASYSALCQHWTF